ncbi:MAG: hypothetical protein KDK71_03685 [Chlamydiia bacterium]|nr:hypothetical protein [Chlamydiia bacterium]
MTEVTDAFQRRFQQDQLNLFENQEESTFQSTLDLLIPKVDLIDYPHLRIYTIKEVTVPMKGEEWSWRWFFIPTECRLVTIADLTFHGDPIYTTEKVHYMFEIKLLIHVIAIGALCTASLQVANGCTKNVTVLTAAAILPFFLVESYLHSYPNTSERIAHDGLLLQETLEELQSDITETEEVKAALQTLSQREGEDMPDGYTCKNGNWKTGSVFLVDSCPNIIFKRSTSISESHPSSQQNPDNRFFYMVLAKYLAKKRNLSHLVIPNGKQFIVNGETWIVEQKLEIDESAETFLKAQNENKLTFALVNLIHFIILTNQADIQRWNCPIVPPENETSQFKIALVDTDIVDTNPGLGFFGDKDTKRRGAFGLLTPQNRTHLSAFGKKHFNEGTHEQFEKHVNNPFFPLENEAYREHWHKKHNIEANTLISDEQIETLVNQFDQKSQEDIRTKTSNLTTTLNAYFRTLTSLEKRGGTIPHRPPPGEEYPYINYQNVLRSILEKMVETNMIFRYELHGINTELIGDQLVYTLPIDFTA